MSKIQIISADGKVEERDAMTFAEASEIIGVGYVEAVRHGDGYVLVHEEGRLRSMPLNELASRLVGRVLVGPAIIVPGLYVDAVLGSGG